MKLLILGGTGMLGHKLWQEAVDPLDAWATTRLPKLRGPAAKILDPARVVTGVSAGDLDSIGRALDESGADAVVNCIGVIKQSAAAVDPIPSISVNSLFPHQVAALCRERGARFLHISTDCVFAGTKGGYTEDDYPDPRDLYGRSKLLGEVAGPGALTVRTSIIGRELATSFGLVEWFLGEAGGSVRGFERAIFSGFTTEALSKILIEILTEHTALEGLWQVSAEPIDKLRLLRLVRDAYGVEIEIEPDADMEVDRSLDSSRFRTATGWSPPGWEQMITAMAADPTPYEEIRRSEDA